MNKVTRENICSFIRRKKGRQHLVYDLVLFGFFIFLPLLIVIGAIYLLKSSDEAEDFFENEAIKINIIANQDERHQLTQGKPIQHQVVPHDQGSPAVTREIVLSQARPVIKPVTIVVRHYDNLWKIFKRLGASSKTIESLLAAKHGDILKKIRAGDILKCTLNDNKTQVVKIEYAINGLDTLIGINNNGNWTFTINHVEPTVTFRTVSSRVGKSIFAAGKALEIPYRVMYKFINSFEDRVNAKRIRASDSFILILKEYSVGGKKVKESDIEGAELVHQGGVHRIISFTDKDNRTEFYTPEGYSIKPAFIRYPVAYSRIGSRFSWSRFHPILDMFRPHLGVDFVAKAGTPVKATSNGRVIYASYRGSYGNTIIIKNGMYSTLYAHLAKFSDRIKVNAYVKQEEVIGYVGSSGLSTGAHLHYEFRINDVPQDPLTVALPSGGKIASKYQQDFFALAKKMSVQLDQVRKEYGL